jgi:hypothetical protein
MTERQRDEILCALGALRGAAPAAARDARVRARCHAAISPGGAPEGAPGGAVGEADGGRRLVPARSMGARLVDTALAVGAGLYGVLVIAEAFRVGWRPLD